MSADYSGTSVPTLNNSPASSWTSDAAKKSHVNDLYLVTGSGASAGNLYAFEEYAKPLVKNATPGEIVTFTDGGDNAPITSASVSLSPIQDLNGYESPWPAGGGKNKCDNALTKGYYNEQSVFVPSDDGSFYTTPLIPVTANTTYVVSFFNSAGTRIAGLVVTEWDSNGTFIRQVTAENFTTTANTAFVRLRNYQAQSSVMQQEGASAHWQLELGTQGSSFSPYSNICPISGHTGAELNRTGKNMWSLDNAYSASASGSFIPVDTTRAFPLKAGTYTWSFNVLAALNTMQLTFVTIDGSIKQVTFYVGVASGTGRKSYTFVLDADVEILRSAFCNSAFSIADIQIELGSSATEYEPYDGDTYSVTFTDQGTVYGGTYDFVTGEGKITWASHEVTTTEGDTATIGGAFCRRIRMDDLKASGNTTNYFSSHFVKPAGSISANPDNGVISNIHWNTNNIAMRNDALTTRDAWDNWVTAQATAGTPVTICYKLATPITFTLSPQQLTTLLGHNVVWSDAGPITQLTYTSNQFTPSFNWFETWTVPKITRDNGNVIVLPKPQEYTPEIYDVDAATTGRNAAGTMIRDRVARKHKFNYKFAALSQQDATEILNAVQDVSFTLTTASPETGAKTNYRVYVGDRSLPVYWMPTHAKASWMYSSLSLNLIEM